MNIQDFQNDKLSIINWVTQLQDQNLIEKIKELMIASQPVTIEKKTKTSNNKDVYQLSKQQEKAIDKALSSLKNGNSIPHETVIEETRKKYPQLFKNK